MARTMSVAENHHFELSSSQTARTSLSPGTEMHRSCIGATSEMRRSCIGRASVEHRSSIAQASVKRHFERCCTDAIPMLHRCYTLPSPMLERARFLSLGTSLRKSNTMKQNPPKNRCKRLRKLTHHCSTMASTSVVSGSYRLIFLPF